ncbi:MAG: ABC transporter substrate-binding protein [Saprospiraceae bacterium]|nr:ABC transporter substrate-binding protein [Saprospiraceae bacterium]
MDLKVGILLPRSDMFPTLAMDFLNGLKLGLNKSGISNMPELVIESIGNAADQLVIKVAEKMILQEEVNLTIAFCGEHQLKELNTLFTAYKKPLLHIDLGGHVQKKEIISPYVLHHTLNLWQSAYAAGVYAANTFGKKAAVAASFYDGGYHLTHGFVSGFTNNGGQIESYYVGPMDYKNETFDSMITKVSEADADVLFTLFSFKEGNKIFDKLSQSELNGKLPIMAFPLMTDEQMNIRNYNLQDVYSAASWAFDDETDLMRSFNTKYTDHYKDEPNIIALMGYEAGLIIDTTLKHNTSMTPQIGEYMRSQHINSPRGTFSFNSYNEPQIDIFKIRKFNFNNVKFHNTVIDTMELPGIEKLYTKFETLPASSWKNPYICT